MDINLGALGWPNQHYNCQCITATATLTITNGAVVIKSINI